MSATEWHWEIAQDANEVHGLLEASDQAQASDAAPAPRRNLERTHYLVTNGCVRLLRKETQAVAMFSLTQSPPFVLEDAGFRWAARPLYLQRLAIEPGCARTMGAVPGINSLRHAIKTARDLEADALRSEANPNLTRTMHLLTVMGFEQQRTAGTSPADNRVYLEFRITAG